MLSQDVVLAFLEASISGAGLVLTVYALIIPFSKRLFESTLKDFLEQLTSSISSLDKMLSGKLDSQAKVKARAYMSKWLESWNFPTYLRFGVGATFFGYTVTTLISIAWVMSWKQPLMDSVLPFFFTASTIVFLFVGLISIKDIHKIMRQDYYELINSLKETEDKPQDAIDY
jgi:hypothetical protein